MTHELERRGRWTHAFLWIPLALVAVFAVLTFLFANECLDDSRTHRWRVVMTTIATPLGPFTGPISRGWQSCCTANAWSIALVAGPILAAGIAAQYLLRAEGRWWDRARLAIWSLSWFVWLASGILALGHALE